MKKNVESGVCMNDEGMVNEYDKGLEEDTVGGKDLAAMNKFYKYIKEVVYMMNFVYGNLEEYLTAELYTMVTLVGALMIWRRRSTKKRRMKESHLSYYEFKLRVQGLTEPCGIERKEVVLHVPVARRERRRQRLHELCQQGKMKVVLWLATMYSAQAVAGGSQGERVFS